MQPVSFPTAIHQRRHALLHPDQDEWQRERRRERANPHPRLPQDRSDAALHEPHRQHGTGCLRHVIIWWPCWRRGIGRVGQKKSTRLDLREKNKIKNKKHGCPVWPNYCPRCLRAPPAPAPTRIRLKLLPKCTLKKKTLLTKKKSLQLFSSFFFKKWTFEKDMWEKKKPWGNVLQ